jgi:hypothetical protein
MPRELSNHGGTKGPQTAGAAPDAVGDQCPRSWPARGETPQARKNAYQALLIEEFARAGTSVLFVQGPRWGSPEDALLAQIQGMIAEYERAQILERTAAARSSGRSRSAPVVATCAAATAVAAARAADPVCANLCASGRDPGPSRGIRSCSRPVVELAFRTSANRHGPHPRRL